MKYSFVEFKTPSADLHRKSPIIFLISLAVSLALTTIMIYIPFSCREQFEENINIPPVIIKLQNIPETRQIVKVPAPAKPYIPGSMPFEVNDELAPDDITIEDTITDFDTFPTLPSLFVPEIGSAKEENEIFELFAVEKKPAIINPIIPKYPEMAKRAGIEGTVYLKVLVNKNGMVDSVHVVKGPKVFQKSSIETAKMTKYTPAKLNNRSVACWVIMPYRFVLEK